MTEIPHFWVKSLSRRILFAAGVTLLLLAAGAAVSYLNTIRLKDISDRLTLARQFDRNLRGVLILLDDAETGQRGYLLTGDEKYLEPYRQAVEQVEPQLHEILKEAEGHPAYASRLDDLTVHVRAKLKELNETVVLFMSGKRSDALAIVKSDVGKKEMDAIRADLGSIEREQFLLSKEAASDMKRAFGGAIVSNVLIDLLALSALGLMIVFMMRETALKARTSHVIAEERERFKVTLTSIGDAVIVTDHLGIVTFINPVACGLTKWSREAAIGAELTKVFDIVNEQTGQPVESPVTKVLRERRVVGLANHTVLVARDGSRLPIDDSGAPIVGEHGEIDGTVLVFRDVTERRKVEEERTRSEEQFRQLANALPQMVWTARPDGYIDYYNDRWYEYTDCPRDSFGDASWEPLLHPDDVQRSKELYYGAIQTGSTYQIEYRFKNGRDGGYRWFLGRAFPVYRNGTIVRWFGSCTDIDDTKRAQEALREEAVRKDEFIALLAHELRNPMVPLRNGVFLMKNNFGDKIASQRTLQMMERQVDVVVRLVDDLLDASRLSRGKMQLRKERTNLVDIALSALETARSRAAAQHQQIETTLPVHPLFVDADPVRLTQMLNNLLNNATKYSPDNSSISFSIESEGGTALIRVKDSGIGIDPAKLDRIFDMFYQVDSTIERSEGGLGLGLSLVKGVTEMHGGSVEARSDGIGKGSEFLVRLPLCGDQSPAPAQLAKSKEKASVRSLRVLIVDDNEDVGDVLAMLVRSHGHEAKTASDADDALQLAGEFLPDVVFQDLGMPRISGFEICRRLRAMRGGERMTIVAVTGFGSANDKQRTNEVGFDSHLVKPPDPGDIEAILRKAAQKSS